MRIIRGIYKGRKIIPPKGFNARPTTDFAKESLFNILDNLYDFETLHVLDLFSGTGNISFEFLSRGCELLTAVEKNKRYAAHIKNQFYELFPEKAKIINSDAFIFAKKSNLDYDIIFADPPFNEKRIAILPLLLLGNNSLRENSLIVIEHPSEIKFTEFEAFQESRKYGHVHFSFFKKIKKTD